MPRQWRQTIPRLALVPAVFALAALGACRPDDTPTDPTVFTDLTGTWTYRATDIRTAGMTCAIPALTVRISQVHGAGAFTGDSSTGEMICTDRLETHRIVLDAFPIVNGYTFNEFLSFDLYNAEWRHGGTVVTPDSLIGTFRLVNGTAEYQGNFSIVRRRNP